ncbi:MAG: DUF3179 domain-containing protein [Saprospiraceae bacterium]|nr:DUF3179 domain-containing protein [Saprospiraceae bacterium]
MKYLFYTASILWILFEFANVYFIMPLPGSQKINSLEFAYSIYSWRWYIRCLLGLVMISGFRVAFQKSKLLSTLVFLFVLFVIYQFNFEFSADKMFYAPKNLILKPVDSNEIDPDRLVLGISMNGEFRAYPIYLIGYHHQVADKIGDKSILITYCTVCRTGRCYEALVNHKLENFRLVGMDHFNALLEDHSTKSWWRQSTGECVVGPLKGSFLAEFPSQQTSLKTWIDLHPNTQIMQEDPVYKIKYDSLALYEAGKSKGKLTKKDSSSWSDKSWIIGIQIGNDSRAYDWNQLIKDQMILDQIGNTFIVLLLSSDKKSFFAFERPTPESKFIFRNDSLFMNSIYYRFTGESLNFTSVEHPKLKHINAYQEFWHSWKTFHPNSDRYQVAE